MSTEDNFTFGVYSLAVAGLITFISCLLYVVVIQLYPTAAVNTVLEILRIIIVMGFGIIIYLLFKRVQE